MWATCKAAEALKKNEFIRQKQGIKIGLMMYVSLQPGFTVQCLQVIYSR